MIASPWDLECKKVKTTQAGCRDETKLGLKFIVKLWEKQTWRKTSHMGQFRCR